MSCCGNSRRQQAAPAQNAPAAAPAGTVGETSARGPVYYEYIGATSITVRGAATGTIYRFGSFGSRVAVDGRDVPTMDTVPNLRRV